MTLGWLARWSERHRMVAKNPVVRRRVNYMVALLAVAVATSLTWHLRFLLGQQLSPLFLAAVMIAAWYGGLGPGLLASALATVASALFLANQVGPEVLGVGGIIRSAVFLFVAVLTSWLNVARKQVQERLRDAYDTLEVRVSERTSELSRLNGLLQEEVATRRRAQEQLMAQQDRLRTLALELSLAEEKERRRIAVELHDQIGQMLALAQMKLDSLRQRCRDPEEVGELEGIRDLVDQTVSRTRSLTGELSPPVLYELGFPAALAWLVERVQKQSGIPLAFEEDDQPKPMGIEMRVLLFQAVRELLANMAKHSKATQGMVRLERVGDFVRIQVEDDGVGFDRAKVANRASDANHYGLFSIRERLRRHGGYLEIESAPGEGARFSLVMEIEPNVAVESLTADAATPQRTHQER